MPRAFLFPSTRAAGMRASVTVRVPGSTSNLGAGFDCIGVAVERWLTLTACQAEEAAGGPVTLERRGTLSTLTAAPEHDLLYRGFVQACRAARRAVPPTVILTAESSIPVARGLGSSAAAAAEEPSPRATGMLDSAVRMTVGGTARRAARQAWTNPRYRRSCSGAAVSVLRVPRRSSVTGPPAASSAWQAVRVSQRSTATPIQSKPAPRFDVEPGTRTVTLARIPAARVEGNRKARGIYAGFSV